MKRFALPLLCLALASCGGANTKAEQSADQLEDAAAQSDPVSAQVLENQADQIRATGNTEALGTPGSPAQDALEEAAVASAPSTQPASTGAGDAPTPKQAKRHEAGDQVPPPKIVAPSAQ